MQKNKFLLLLAGYFFIFAHSSSQSFPVQFKGKTLKTLYESTTSASINAGEEISLVQVNCGKGNCKYTIVGTKGSSYIEYPELSKIAFDTPGNIEDLWCLLRIINGTYENISKAGIQPELRNDLRDEATETLVRIKHSEGLYSDRYISDYLNSLLLKILPDSLPGPLPSRLRVFVMKSQEPRSFVLPDGTLIISLGMLAQLESEDQLLAILTQEVAHYILDHPILNINAQISRERKADFWTGMATLMAAMGEIATDHHRDYFWFEPGDFTATTALVSGLIASAVISRMGNEYSNQQQDAASKAAMDALFFLGRDPEAMNQANEKINSYYSRNDYPSESQSFANTKIIKPDPEYDVRMSSVIRLSAAMELETNHYSEALRLANRNINGGMATGEEYLIKARSICGISDSPESNLEALALIKMAREITPTPNPQYDKEEGLIYMRLNRNKEAEMAFEKYRDAMQSIDPEESRWAERMVRKCQVI